MILCSAPSSTSNVRAQLQELGIHKNYVGLSFPLIMDICRWHENKFNCIIISWDYIYFTFSNKFHGYELIISRFTYLHQL
jgi:hypothetical protein